MATIRVILRSLLHRYDGLLPVIFCSMWVGIAIFSRLYTPYPLTYTDGYHPWENPSFQHLLGTDGAGADIFTWLMAGSATELVLVLSVAFVTAACGMMGLFITLSQNKLIRMSAVVLIDALISIPTVVIALICAAQWGPTIAGVIVACSCAYSLNLMRVVRPIAHRVSQESFVTFARYKGSSEWQIFMEHILPHLMPAMIINVSLAASTSILAESGLTYLGIGVPLDIPSWGHSLAIATNFVSIHPSVAIYPGIVITVAVIMLNFLGDALRECTDPLTNPALRKMA